MAWCNWILSEQMWAEVIHTSSIPQYPLCHQPHSHFVFHGKLGGHMFQMTLWQDKWSLHEPFDRHQTMTYSIKPLRSVVCLLLHHSLPLLTNKVLLRARTFQQPERLWESLLATSHLERVLANRIFQILCQDIFLSIVPFSSSTSELPPHSHFVVVCLFQREINQGLIRKEIVYSPYILV